ncbi:hypothetical protein U1Q18_015796 [Sarracenia purpurea var. burkii]
MAFTFKVTVKHCLLAFSLISVSIFGSKFGTASADPVEDPVEDPSQIVVKALLCFNDKYIYSSCEEAFRLTESGNLNVPPQYTDPYCTGPCLTETNLVLDCVDDILNTFEFYNKATIHDVRDTIKAGCGYGSQRGNFDVAEHIQAGESNAGKMIVPMIVGLVWMILAQCLMF